VRGLRLPVADDVVRGVVDKQQRRCSRRVVLEYDAHVVLLDDTLHQDTAVLHTVAVSVSKQVTYTHPFNGPFSVHQRLWRGCAI